MAVAITQKPEQYKIASYGPETISYTNTKM